MTFKVLVTDTIEDAVHSVSTNSLLILIGSFTYDISVSVSTEFKTVPTIFYEVSKIESLL